MTDKTARGRFVWHELMTPDPSASQAFYSKLGWKAQPWDQNPSYVMFAGPNGPLGATVAWVGGAPHWVAYIGSTDIRQTVDKAKSLGASVVKDVTSTGGGGDYAILKDPQGAAFGVYASAQDPAPEGDPKRGEFSWHELMTSDHKAALEFYSTLFGWQKLGEHDMGPMGTYVLFGRNGRQLGGMMTKGSDMPGDPVWNNYVRVKDLAGTVKKIKAGGGTVILEPMEVPGGDWISMFVDPQGAAFAVHTVKADLAPAAPAPAAPASAPAKPAEAKAAAPKPAAAAKPATPTTPAAAPAKKAPAKKAPAKKAAAKPAAKKAAKKKKKKAAAKGAKRPVKKVAKASRKAAKKASKKAARKQKRSGGKTKKKARKARKSK
jgi:predicted enzyme related to lactoylglutathione lyase